jgi:low temperature requirement protein LtrA
MTERTSPQGVSIRGSLGRWFLAPPRPHGEIVTDRTVGFLELFYDLVYVVLIAQAAHTLAADISWETLGEFAVVFGLIWMAWVNGTLFHELHGREDGRNRTLIFAQMLLLGVLGTYVGHAADSDGAEFAAVFALLLFLLAWQWFTVVRRDTAQYRRVSLPFLLGVIASALIMAASVFAPAPYRILIWALFLLAWIVFSSALFSRDRATSTIPTESVVERFGLFTIIVLGEVVVGVVEGLSEAERGVPATATAALALTIGFGLWWNYFDAVGRRLPGTGSRYVLWLFGHLPATLAIAAAGAAMVSLIEHSGEVHTPAGTSWLLSGAVAAVLVSLILIAKSLVKARTVPGVYRPLPFVLGTGALAVLFVGWMLPAPWILALAIVIALSAGWLVMFIIAARAGTPIGASGD